MCNGSITPNYYKLVWQKGEPHAPFFLLTARFFRGLSYGFYRFTQTSSPSYQSCQDRSQEEASALRGQVTLRLIHAQATKVCRKYRQEYPMVWIKRELWVPGGLKSRPDITPHRECKPFTVSFPMLWNLHQAKKILPVVTAIALCMPAFFLSSTLLWWLAAWQCLAAQVAPAVQTAWTALWICLNILERWQSSHRKVRNTNFQIPVSAAVAAACLRHSIFKPSRLTAV